MKTFLEQRHATAKQNVERLRHELALAEVELEMLTPQVEAMKAERQNARVQAEKDIRYEYAPGVWLTIDMLQRVNAKEIDIIVKGGKNAQKRDEPVNDEPTKPTQDETQSTESQTDTKDEIPNDTPDATRTDSPDGDGADGVVEGTTPDN